MTDQFSAHDMATAASEGFRAGQGSIQTVADGRWYMVTRDGMATLCVDHEDAEAEARKADREWPRDGPHRAVQLVEASFEAADMATASAQWFRDGAASTAPPTAQAEGWVSVQDELPKCSKKPDSFGVEVLIWPPHEDGSGTAFYGRRQSREPNFYKYGALLGHVEFWRYLPPPPTSAEGVEHG